MVLEIGGTILSIPQISKLKSAKSQNKQKIKFWQLERFFDFVLLEWNLLDFFIVTL
jgi:hypothetical protein